MNQDNQSAILLEKNGCASSGKRTCHINICYFFVADRVASNEVSIQYCPTGEMIADFFTKPLQGALFQKFRDFIMNHDPSTDSLSDHTGRSVLRNETNNAWVKCGRRTDAKVRLRREPQNVIEQVATFSPLVPGPRRLLPIFQP